MQKTSVLFNKTLVIGVFVLLTVSSIMPISGSLPIKKQISTNNEIPKIPGYTRGNTLYVGGTGPGNYTKIQDAIDNASNGDIVFVYDDSSPYNEDIIINKRIMLVGEDKNTTLINSSKYGEVVIINSDNVLISGFMIHGKHANGLNINSNNNIVSNNYFSDCFRGIVLNDSTSGNEIFQNTINDSTVGIKFIESSANKIYNNLISNGYYGILVWYESVNNQIINNTFESNRDLGIRLSTTSATLSGNIFSNNTIGLALSYCSDNFIKNNCFINDGISLWESYRNIVENNTINEKPLIYLEEKSNMIIDDSAGQVFLVSCNNITVRKLEFSHACIGVGAVDTVDSKIENSIFSKINRYAISILYSENIVIENNTIENQIKFSGSGIRLHSHNNTVKNNVIKNGASWGIELGGYNNSVFGNNISNNKNGIYFGGYNNTINNNKIYNNQHTGIKTSKYNSENNTVLKNNIVNNNIGIRVLSNNNTVLKNNIVNNNIGIEVPSNQNLILKNNITNNNLGINISSSYYNYSFNKIYYNNFINNNQSAYDNENNTWDNGYPSGGNYWDDYTGNDSDGDGIGDTPYPIPGGDNEDRYPLMEPWKITYPVANFTYSAEESPVLFNGSSSYDPDGEIVSYDWDFGDGTTGTGEITYHKYCEVGTYDVTLTVTDDDGLTVSITKCVDVLVVNILPSLEINGPNKGKPGIEYEFDFIISDPDDDEIYIMVDWGDGTTTGWMGPYNPGLINISYRWDMKGIYLIRVKLKDSCGETEWSDAFQIEIPRNRMSIYSLFLRFLERFPLLERLLNFLLL